MKLIYPQNQSLYSSVFFRSIVLDYEIKIKQLAPPDRIFVGGALGNYSLAGFEMILHRHVSHYIINYYLPSGLFVVVSWISFLVPPDIIPGRMALLVTVFLVLINIFNTVTSKIPKADGNKLRKIIVLSKSSFKPMNSLRISLIIFFNICRINRD